VSATEISYLDGVTSAIQTQLDAKQTLDADLTAIAGLTSAADKGIQFTGSGTAAVYTLTTAGKALLDDANADAQLVTLGLTASAAELNIMDGVTSTAAELNALDGITATVTELNYTDGVTSAIQTQMDTKAPLASPTFTGTPVAPTAAVNVNTTQVATTAYVITALKDAEVVTATNADISAVESGKTFFLSSATEFVSTLPAPALGLRYTFIVTAAPSGASYTVVTNSSANIIIGQQQSVAGDAGDFGTADDTITFVDGQAVAGDRVDVISDGTSWFAYAQSKVAAGITFTQASA